MKITVGLSTSDALISRCIRWFTGSKASHALTIVDLEIIGHPRMVLEALSTGYIMHPMPEWLKTNTMVREVTPAGDMVKGYMASLNWLTDDYDWGGLVGMAFVLLGRRLKLKLKNPLNSGRALFCSEAVTQMLQLAGTPGAEALIADDTSPADLLTFFDTAGTTVS